MYNTILYSTVEVLTQDEINNATHSMLTTEIKSSYRKIVVDKVALVVDIIEGNHDAIAMTTVILPHTHVLLTCSNL